MVVGCAWPIPRSLPERKKRCRDFPASALQIPPRSLLLRAAREEPLMVGSTFGIQPGCRYHTDEGKQAGAVPGPRAWPWLHQDPWDHPAALRRLNPPVPPSAPANLFGHG